MTQMTLRRSWVLWPLVAAVAAIFVYSGLRKLGWTPWGAMNALPPAGWRRVATILEGALLMGGGVGVIFRRTRRAASIVAAMILFLAMGSHAPFFHGRVTDMLGQVVTPVVLLVALLAVNLADPEAGDARGFSR